MNVGVVTVAVQFLSGNNCFEFSVLCLGTSMCQQEEETCCGGFLCGSEFVHSAWSVKIQVIKSLTPCFP
jgi:hypothetical protein